MATTIPALGQTSYGLPKPMKDQQAWIVKYINEVHSKNAGDVIVVGVSEFKGGGGGLYCKVNESEQTYNALKEAAVKAGAPEGVVVKGKFLLVKSDSMKPGEKGTTCFILWHEFGHALADRGVGSNVGETSAWRFELQAITHAVSTGLPTGISKDMVWGFLDMRRKGNLTGLDDLIEDLEEALGPRPMAITDDYCYSGKACSVSYLGAFDSTKFKTVVQEKFKDLTPADKLKVKTATNIIL